MNLSTDQHSSGKKHVGEPQQVRKFMFDRSFDDAALANRAPERKPQLLKPEQIDALKKEAYEAGVDEGKRLGHDLQMAQLASLFSKIETSLATLIEGAAQHLKEQEAHTKELVLVIAKKIIPDFAVRNGLAEIESLLALTIKEMAREPRLVVRINEIQFDEANDRVQAIANQRAYPGKVIVLADPEVLVGDCRVEWADGGIERNVQSTWSTIEHTIFPSS